MTRNLLRLTALIFVLSTTFILTLPDPVLAATCGSGDYFVRCSKKCCGPDVQTTYWATGLGSSCTAARSTCGSCLPACPSGQSLCGGPTYGTCGF